MTTRSTPFFVGVITATGAADHYTVPDGYVALIKFWQLVNRSGVDSDVRLLAKSPAAATTDWRSGSCLGDGTPYGGETWFVLDEGWKLRIQTTQQPIACIIAGALLPKSI